jgi:putative ATP-dependent endonuclease of OLD family
MYISKIHIKGFRNFKDQVVTFNDGVNVIIGHNNAGKTNLMRALALVIDYQGIKRLDIDDFCKNISLSEIKANPPRITVSLSIYQSEYENLNSDDLVTVSNWLIKLEPPYEAMLTYEFFLPEKEIENFKKSLEDVTDMKKIWQIIKHDFIRFYVYKIFGGVPNILNIADNESLQKFDFQFLDAIRDVERDMLSGRNTLLREVLDFFMDYEVKNDDTKTIEERNIEIKQKKRDFSDQAETLLNQLRPRMIEGKKQILSYANETGATFNRAHPDFEGIISDADIFSALRLIVAYETGVSIPATHNGLGYNNLIFMSLLLAKMQVNSDGSYLGSNAKVFPVLAIEEPEAHLHPAMQYKFLKFLRDNRDVKKKVKQVFVTTHSTQITSAVSLDEIICLDYDGKNLTVGYPGKVFSEDEQGRKAKAYVQRFLDATKSDMLFAKSVLFVEGISEQLLLSTLAKYVGQSLEDNHVAVINVGGRYFDYFLCLFDIQNSNTIHKKVACLIDRDPVKKDKLIDNGRYTKCYPYEFQLDSTQYDYKDNATVKINQYEEHGNIRFFTQESLKGKTFEYDLALHNPSSLLLITDSLSNKEEIRDLMESFDDDLSFQEFLQKLTNSEENELIKNKIEANLTWSNTEKKKAVVASRYLNSVGKGENALELAFSLEENYKQEQQQKFVVPFYIKKAIEWICQ